ncbi:hypothetical protein BASA81_008092 [Batrachochytrium salamandrivorans]|nr:hypothetical protein BASA81_008092 [Batrachochytrium salamandrivorans]
MISSSSTTATPNSLGNGGESATASLAGKKKTTGPLHNPRYKSTMCQHFANTGACPYSEKCQFAHGPEELAKWQETRAVQQLLSEQSQSFHRLQQQQQQQQSRYVYVSQQPPHHPPEYGYQQFDYLPQQPQQQFASPRRFGNLPQQQPPQRYSPRSSGMDSFVPPPQVTTLPPTSSSATTTPLYQKKASLSEFRSEPRNLFAVRTQDFDEVSSTTSNDNDSHEGGQVVSPSSQFRRNHSLPHMYTTANYRASSSMTNVFEPLAAPSTTSQSSFTSSQHQYYVFPSSSQYQPSPSHDPSYQQQYAPYANLSRPPSARNRRGSAPPVVLSESLSSNNTVSLADFTDLDHLADEMVSEQGKEMVLNSTPSTSFSSARTSQLFSMPTVFPSSINDCL